VATEFLPARTTIDQFVAQAKLLQKQTDWQPTTRALHDLQTTETALRLRKKRLEHPASGNPAQRQKQSGDSAGRPPTHPVPAAAEQLGRRLDARV
jgi:hypothetical protein